MTTPVLSRRAFWSILVFAFWTANSVSAGQFGDFTYTDEGTSITITDYPNSAVGAVEIPAMIAGKPVTSIAGGASQGAFDYCIGVTSVTIPSSVTVVGKRAFSACSSLTSVTIPSSVTVIEERAFSACSSLTSITIPDSVTTIGDYAFHVCTGLTNLNITGGRYITFGANAFNGCTGLTSLTLGNCNFGNGSFANCSNLGSVTIGNCSFGNQVFAYCSGLNSAYFMGNASGITSTDVFRPVANGFTVYYFNGRTGFTGIGSGWNNYATVNLGSPAPVATTSPAIGITATSAMLQGAAKPNGSACYARFDYGPTTSYGNSVGVSLSPNIGVAVQAVSASIAGLQSGKTYHYRLLAENADGWNYSEDMTFTTNNVLTINTIHGSATGAGEYPPNTTATLAATPFPGYLFTSWAGDATGTDNPLSVLMNADKTISATFSPDTNDTDDDGWTNYEEIVIHGTNPTLPDTDDDDVKDSMDAFPLDPAETLDTDHDGTGDNADTDDDGDGLSDTDEITIHGTNPKRADSDGDGLSDPAEIQTYLTNPNIADTDNDGLSDGAEVNTHGTNPKDGDSDDDGFLDGYEVLTGKSPLDDQDKPALVAEARTAIEFTFPAAIGKTYRIEASTDLEIWETVESGIAGAGVQLQRFYSTRGMPKRYFRVEEDAP